MHRDSLGTVQRVVPGTVGWMTAGKGIVHTERTPQDLRDGNQYPLHGFQIWVALPDHLEDMDPEFSFTLREQLPHLDAAGYPLQINSGKRDIRRRHQSRSTLHYFYWRSGQGLKLISIFTKI